MRVSEEAIREMVDYLYGLQRAIEGATGGGDRGVAAKARGILARLRRTAGKAPGESLQALPYVVLYLPEAAQPWEREVFFLLAGLFAVHPTPYTGKVNFGGSLRQAGRSDSAERRFTALLNCDPGRLPHHLRQAVSILASADGEPPIDYYTLARDLLHWNHPDRLVQIRWAQQYWRPEAPPEPLSARNSPSARAALPQGATP